MTGIFLDRRILLDHLINRNTIPIEALSARLDDYDTVAYEASGASGMEYALARVPELRSKLVGIPPSELTPPRGEEKLFAKTLDIAADTQSIRWAAMKYQQSAQSHADPMESVSYTLRLLSAVRSGSTDLGVHRERLPIVLQLFAESGVNLDSAADNVLVSEPCDFPHLPHAAPGSTIYRIVPMGGNEHDGSAMVPKLADTSAPIGKRIFIAYSHRDQVWLNRLLEVLNPFVRAGDIDVWSDLRIASGQPWRDEIEQALAAADAGIMLVSASFLASDFVTQHEIPALLKRHQTDKIRVSWIAVSASLYRYTPVEHFQALNDPKRPLAELTAARRQRELVNIAEKIKDMLRSGRST
jgi:TIR domain